MHFGLFALIPVVDRKILGKCAWRIVCLLMLYILYKFSLNSCVYHLPNK